MKTTLKLAFRNLLRNKRRTGLTVSAFAAGMAIIMATNTLMKGTHEATIERAVERSSGHLQIQYKDYHDNPILYNSLELAHINQKQFEKMDGVEAFFMRIDSPVLAESQGKTRLLQIRGIHPEKEAEYGGLKNHLEQGTYLNRSDPDMVYVGSGVAAGLDISPGDTIFFIGEARDLSVAAGKYTVGGVFETGQKELDRNLALMNYAAAESLFAMEGFATAGVVMLESTSAMDSVKQNLSADLTEDERIVEWREIIPELVQIVELDALFGDIMILILGMIALFGVVNTLITAILERRQEFAILLALGAPAKEIFRMVLVEAVFLSVFAVIPGAILGILGSLYFVYNPIPLTGEAATAIKNWGFEPYMYGRLSASNIWGTSLVFVLLGILFSLWPAILASRTNISERLQVTE